MTVQLRGVTAGYGDRLVLHDCDLSLAAGEVVSVVGPNGAGKSTLLRVIAGLVAPRGGTASLDGTPVGALRRADLARRVAVVPQSFETLFPFTVRELVALGRTARLDLLGRSSPDDAAAVVRAMETLELTVLAERRVDQLSGGERQRVVLAMALAQETAVLLLDEPTVHLDPAHQLATIALMRRLARERGLAVLAVVHDLTLAALADRVVVLAAGRIVRDGSPLDVIDAELVREVFGPGWHVAVHAGRPLVHPDLGH
ncbi:MAG TPA: ABC transporter ATP-binding protein [Candidatus Limnocylindria bacterium]|nr:ABC transporter ATP-binding protein [Candidatus Limnocylindria bacterium]